MASSDREAAMAGLQQYLDGKDDPRLSEILGRLKEIYVKNS